MRSHDSMGGHACTSHPDEVQLADSSRIVYLGDRPESPAQMASRGNARTPRAPGARADVPLDPESAEFFDWVCRRHGLDSSRYRSTVLGRRRGACLRAIRTSSLEEARRVLEHNPAALDRIIDSLMIGVTSFFRDQAVFDAIGRAIPGLAASAQGPLRVLCVACSDGSELYSMAIQLAEAGVLRGAALRGVDCRASAIEAAREGVYLAEDVSHLRDEIRNRHFIAEPSQNRTEPRVRVSDHLRRSCTWEIGDAFALERREPVDIVLCRNLAIYLEASAAERLWTSLAAHLRPGGLLVAGNAERPATTCRLARVGPCVYRNREDRP